MYCLDYDSIDAIDLLLLVQNESGTRKLSPRTPLKFTVSSLVEVQGLSPLGNFGGGVSRQS